MSLTMVLFSRGVFFCCFALAVAATHADGASPDFTRDVQPILKRHCDRCHGAVNREASLALDGRAGLLGTADSDEAIVKPGNASESLLIRRITDEDEGDIMPLDGQPLSKQEIAVLTKWINDGAVMPDGDGPQKHWAYVAPHIDANTLANARGQSDSAIDYFVDRRLQSVGLRATEGADPAVLARRVSLALTGLPATLDQIKSLERDPSAKNYARFVDELLQSEAFGVHWARHWLDLARYADSNGFQADQLRDSWAYRDWVVDAFNADMPFDRFVIQQLAGDLLPDADDRSRIATGFHRTPTCNVEAGVHPEANRVQQVFDRVNTTATVFLGSTMECAQCHDHKYDPFTQTDYYRLFAYFNNTPLEVEKTAGVTYDFVGPKMDLPLSSTLASQRRDITKEIADFKQKKRDLRINVRFNQWRKRTAEALAEGRARWVTPKPTFRTNSGEGYRILGDDSVLLEGSLPGSTLYRFDYESVEGTISAIRVDALRHDSLPGGGPGRGDAERTNFVLHELELSIRNGNKKSRRVPLGNAKASFSQAKYDVAQAVDGNVRTGWAIAPQFKKEHWATFQLIDPLDLERSKTLSVTLDQRFGRGRVIGRPKISFLVGPPETADLPEEIATLLLQADHSKDDLKRLRKYHQENDSEVQKLDLKIQALTKQLDQMQPPSTLVMVEQEEARETFVMMRGDYLAPGQEVQAGTPASLHSLDETLPPNRLGLAQWLISPDNPLLSRVTVNRFWAQIFGQGIVATPEDFGTQSEPPTHPELLDWLALEFQSNGWSIKGILRTIVLSKTFKRSSQFTDASLEADPENRLLSRGPRFRLPAETLRDNALAISGLLSHQQGGPPIMPFQPSGIWRAVGRNQPKWKAATDQNRYRRGLYVVWKRSAPYPSFVSFDAPDRAACTVKRPRTNTPLQALVLMNDQAYAEAAVALAQRMVTECASQDPHEVAGFGFRLATGCRPSDATLAALTDLFQQQSQRMRDSPKEAGLRLGVLPDGFRHSIEAVEDSDLAAWYSVASALLNLDQTITQN